MLFITVLFQTFRANTIGIALIQQKKIALMNFNRFAPAIVIALAGK
jgi:hypothetical protein